MDAPPSRPVLFLDLDDFKTVNETFGYDAGDRLLVSVAERVEDCLGEEDLVARLGGDEFMVLLDGDTDYAVRTAGEILRVLQRPFAFEGGQLPVTASIGIASNAVASDDQTRDLLRLAELAMYQSKRGGKATANVFDGGG